MPVSLIIECENVNDVGAGPRALAMVLAGIYYAIASAAAFTTLRTRGPVVRFLGLAAHD